MVSASVISFAPGSAAVPRAMPAWVYNNAEMTRLELERILRPSWQLVCHVSSIPNPGDFITFDLGSDSVIVIRDRQSAVRAFYNVCRHRGTRIADGSGSCAATITCPYHGWSYRFDGTLLSTPMRDSFPSLDREALSLKPVRMDIAFGFVYICLAGDPPPVTQNWGPFLQELAPYRFEDAVPLGPVYYEHWDADWKVAMDNYLESYHVPIGHPGLSRMFTPDYEDCASSPGIGRGISWMHEEPSPRWSERLYQKLARSVTTHLPEPQRRSWGFYSVLPNLGIEVLPDKIGFFQVLPRGPGKCSIRGAMFGLPDARREMRIMRYLSDRINRAVNSEDSWLCHRLQRGIASSAYEPGPLSSLERWTVEFHDLIRKRIPEARLASAPSHFL